jgi:hypothetical protein
MEQDLITWDGAIEGRISERWRPLQEAHQQAEHERRTTATWVAGLCGALLTYTHSMWVARNHFLHARDQRGLRKSEREQLDRLINACLAIPETSLLADDRRLAPTSAVASRISR